MVNSERSLRTKILFYCYLTLVAHHSSYFHDGKSPFVSGAGLVSFFQNWGRPSSQEDPFERLNKYLLDNTDSPDFGPNVKLTKYLVRYDKFHSLEGHNSQQEPANSEEFKEFASSFADLSDGRLNAIGHHFQLCSRGNLANLRSIAEQMGKSPRGPRAMEKLRLGQLVKQVTEHAGRVCMARLELKWFSLKRQNESSFEQTLAPFRRAIWQGFSVYANLSQKYLARRALDEDDVFKQCVKFSLERAVKAAPNSEEIRQQNKELTSERILGLLQSLLLEPCQRMVTTSELLQTIKPMVDLLVTSMIVVPDSYNENYIQPLGGEVQDWLTRFAMCELLLDVSPEKMARSLARVGRYEMPISL